MKGIVVYYSATGNTKKTARAIHQGMKQVIDDCDVASIKEVEPQEMARYDLIGVGGPIWFYRETANLRLFIYNMPNLEGKLGFPFCSHGASPAGFMFSIVPALQRKGLTIIGYNDWYGGVEQVIHMPKPYFTDGHPDEIDLKEAEEFGRAMAERAIKISSGETNLIPELPKGPDSDLLWQPVSFAQDGAPIPGEKVEVHRPIPRVQRTINMEKCKYPECTICVDNCLMNSIDFSVTPPAFRQNCLNENLCNRMCPENAITVSAADARPRRQRSINMEKCTYPECTLCVDHCPMDAIDFSVTPPAFKWTCEGDNLCWVICPRDAIEMSGLGDSPRGTGVNEDHPFIKLLNQAEAEGRFRWLVPMDKIGWDTPIYKTKKLPRFVVDDD